MDESGHDHRSMPYEVRGGVALHASRVWPFVQKMRALAQEAFGVSLHEFATEIKGSKLLDKDRFRWAAQETEALPDVVRRNHAKAFLTKKLTKEVPNRSEFTAYGQASLLLARSIFWLLEEEQAVLFASAVPRSTMKPPTSHNPEDLRKDIVFLLERYTYFLVEKEEMGLLIMDETEHTDDRRQISRLNKYFSLTAVGRERARHIVCIYCINWGFRLPERGMDAPIRREMAEDFGAVLSRLQWRGQGSRQGAEYASYGIVCVSDLYVSR